MVSRINPYLNFDGTAREAMTYYADALGGTATFSTFGEYGQPDMPEADRIMHSQIMVDDAIWLMGADTMGGMNRTQGDNITVSLSGGPDDGLADVWAKLIDGGTVTVPMEKQVWGDEFGMCVDKFGIPWIVNLAGQ